MATECCGKSRSSRFCPDCGKAMDGGGGLTGLLGHCRSTERKYRTQARNHEQSGATEFRRANADDPVRTADKWKAWGDALAELIGKAEG